MRFMVLMSLSLMMLSGIAFAETAKSDPVQINGFVDVLYRFSPNDSAESGPGINDAAVYFKKTLEQGEVVLDLPFKGGVVNGVNSNSFQFATEKAQAYVTGKCKHGGRFKAGQFDSIYGFEGADSVDRRFSQAGIESGLVPTTHTGLLIGYDYSENFGLSVLAANPNNTGALNNDNLHFGSQLTYSSGQWRSSLGYAIHKDPALQENATDSLLNVLAGVTLGAFTSDFEVDLKKTAGVEKSATGLAAHLGYGVTESVEAGARLEYLGNVPQGTGYTESQMAATVGPQFALGKDLKLGVEYTLLSVKATADATADTTHSGAFSLRAKF